MEGETLKCILEINHHPLPNYRLFKKETVALSTLLLSSGAAPLPGFFHFIAETCVVWLLSPPPPLPPWGAGGVCPSSGEARRGLGQSHQPSQLWCVHSTGVGGWGGGRHFLPCVLGSGHGCPKPFPFACCWLGQRALQVLPCPSLPWEHGAGTCTECCTFIWVGAC